MWGEILMVYKRKDNKRIIGLVKLHCHRAMHYTVSFAPFVILFMNTAQASIVKTR